MTPSSLADVRHTVLEPAGGRSRGLDDARLTDQERVAVLLQAAAVASLLPEIDLVAAVRATGLRVDPDGVLFLSDPERWVTREISSPARRARLLLGELLRVLFGNTSLVVPGRGVARVAVRRLQRNWGQSLVDRPPDRLVAELLDGAPFLWRPRFARARAGLMVVRSDAGCAATWVAGPGSFRRAVLAGGRDPRTVAELLQGPAAHQAWLERNTWTCTSTEGGEGRAWGLYRAGQFSAAAGAVEGVSADALVLRLLCDLELGRLGACRRHLTALEGLPLEGRALWAAARAAVRVYANLGQRSQVRAWMARALSQRRSSPPQAHAIAAQGYWDLGDLGRATAHLGCAERGAPRGSVVAEVAQSWSLVHLARGEGELAAARLSDAIVAERRHATATRAGRLWTDLVSARALSDDLRGAERAARHAFRLLSGCEGPLAETLALHNLAEVRIRRGRLRGTGEILARAEAANELAGNTRAALHDRELRGRWLLARGELVAAEEHLRDSLDGCAPEEDGSALRVLLARATAWRGRPAAAAALLDRERLDGVLEPEEVPALLLQAGLRTAAVDACRGRAAGLWRRVALGEEPSAAHWREVEALEPYRFARLVLDLATLTVEVSPPRVWRACRLLSACEAAGLADLLRAQTSPLLEELARAGQGAATDVVTVRHLLALAGEPGAELSFRRARAVDAEVVLPGPSRGREVQAQVAAGTWTLRVAQDTVQVRSLFQLLVHGLTALPPPECPARSAGPTHGIVGESDELVAAVERAARLAGSDIPLLVLGESGTGKELIARLAHRSSPRSGAPFVAVNCAALSESLVLSELFGHVKGAFTGAQADRRGAFEEASPGTLFLDEIGDLQARAQGMLLRVLQEGEIRRLGENRTRPVDVRIVAATHRDLEGMVEEGSFRQDLLYRLRGASVRLPPLRERGDDVSLLATAFSQGEGMTIDRAALARLGAHTWPGNVRELQLAVRTAAALARAVGRTTIFADDVDLEGAPRAVEVGYHDWLLQARRAKVRDSLRAAGGNQSAAARKLGLTRQALSYLVRELDLVGERSARP